MLVSIMWPFIHQEAMHLPPVLKWTTKKKIVFQFLFVIAAIVLYTNSNFQFIQQNIGVFFFEQQLHAFREEERIGNDSHKSPTWLDATNRTPNAHGPSFSDLKQRLRMQQSNRVGECISEGGWVHGAYIHLVGRRREALAWRRRRRRREPATSIASGRSPTTAMMVQAAYC